MVARGTAVRQRLCVDWFAKDGLWGDLARGLQTTGRTAFVLKVEQSGSRGVLYMGPLTSLLNPCTRPSPRYITCSPQPRSRRSSGIAVRVLQDMPKVWSGDFEDPPPNKACFGRILPWPRQPRSRLVRRLHCRERWHGHEKLRPWRRYQGLGHRRGRICEVYGWV